MAFLKFFILASPLLSTVSASAIPAIPALVKYDSPSVTKINHKGSSQCSSELNFLECELALDRYVSGTTYTKYTSYVKSFCTAIFVCDNYGSGMTGSQIKEAGQKIFENNNNGGCGSVYLSNSCHVTLNYCSSCKNVNTK